MCTAYVRTVVNEPKVPHHTSVNDSAFFFQPLIPLAQMRNRDITAVCNGHTGRPLAFTCRRLLKMSGLLWALCRIWMSLRTMSSSPFTTAMWRALQRRRRRANDQALFTPMALGDEGPFLRQSVWTLKELIEKKSKADNSCISKSLEKDCWLKQNNETMK